MTVLQGSRDTSNVPTTESSLRAAVKKRRHRRRKRKAPIGEAPAGIKRRDQRKVIGRY